MKVPILTYHSLDIEGNDYGTNNLVAFASDLEQISSNGFRILPLSTVVDLWLTNPAELESRRTIALTCDDGSNFDYHDLPHPVAGQQRSIINILKDFGGSTGSRQPVPCITSFVIVSPQARTTLDQASLIGRGWWSDEWWNPAIATGLMEIANHSWDHNHENLAEGEFPGVERGTFASIVTDPLADYQIANASDYLHRNFPNPGAGLFAYPYGKSNAFLASEYFPRRAGEIGVKAAFADNPEPLHAASDCWQLPRYIHRSDWKTPSDLQRILDDAG